MRNVKKRAVESATSSLMVLGQPYGIWLAVLIFGAILSAWANQTDKVPEVIVGVILSTLILTLFTWHTSRSRRDFSRIHSTITSGLIGVWLISAIAFTVTNQTVFMAWLMGGITLCLSWNIKNAIRDEKRIDAIDQFFVDAGLEGTRLQITEKSTERIKGIIRVARGKSTIEDVQRLTSKFATLFKTPRNGVRIQPDFDDASKAYFTATRKDLLATKIPYTYNDSLSTADSPICIGKYEDGDPTEFSLHSPSIGAIHMLIQGMNGSGKSESAKVIFAESFKQKNVAHIVIDTVKGSQTLGLLIPGIDWFIDNEALAKAVFVKFSKVIKARADRLGELGKSKWDDESELTFIHLHIEEASGLIADNPSFIKMMEAARSVGIQITASLQRASYNSIDTSARAQFSSVLCFGVQDLSDAAFALPDDVIDSGANPAAWRNSKPGYAYLVHPEVDMNKWAVPLRTSLITDDQLKLIVSKKERVIFDKYTAEAFGELLDNPTPEEIEVDEQEEKDMEEELKELEKQFDTFLEFDNSTQGEISTQEAIELLEARIEELRSQRSFKAPELSDVLIRADRSRAWLHKQLARLVDEKKLVKDGYTYYIQ